MIRNLFKPQLMLLLLFPLFSLFAVAGEPITTWSGGDVQVKTLDGKTMPFESIRDKSKPTLVIFGCNHCPYVKAWAERISSLGALALSKGISVVMVNSNDDKATPDDSFEKMKEFKTVHHFSFPYVMDETSRLAKIFGATRTPEVFLFNAQGTRVYHGAIDDNGEDAKAVKNPYLKNAIETVLKNKTVTPAETKFIGCSIKFRKG